MTLQDKQSIEWLELQTPEEIMYDLMVIYDRDKFYVLYSGGKDSVCVVDFIARNYPKQFGGVVFTNTGCGTQATRRFVIDYCKRKGWKLFMTWASPNERFLLVALRHGFAFAGNHGMWMGYLKSHTWYYFLKSRLALGEKACFISGVRKTESRARRIIKGYTKKPIDINATQVFGKPFLYKNGTQIWNYFLEYDLEKTDVYDWANKSGECWCGSHTNSWDLKLLEKYDKLQFENIQWVEKMMKIVLERLMKTNNVTFDHIAKWHRMFIDKDHPELRDLLTQRQKQMVCLTYYNKWGDQRTNDIVAQTTFEDFQDKMLFKINEDYCGESC